MGLNRYTIKNVINIATSWDSAKKNLLSSENFSKGTFFATLLDGVNMSTELRWLYEKNTSVIPRYLGNIFETRSNLIPFITSYYMIQDRDKRLGKKWTPFQYELGSISLSGMSENLIVKMDQNILIGLSGSALELWKTIKKEENFPSAILTKQWIPLETFLGLDTISDIIALNIMIQFDRAIQGNDSLLRNMTFSMNMGHDEIGFTFHVWRKHDEIVPIALTIQSSPARSSDIWMIGWIVIFFITLWGGVWFVVRRRQLSITTPSMPYWDGVIEKSPVITSQAIHPDEIHLSSLFETIVPSAQDTIPGTK